jgi:hypothetical protein
MLVRLFFSEVILSVVVGKRRIVLERGNLELRIVRQRSLLFHGWELLSTVNYREIRETFRGTEMEKKGAEYWADGRMNG